MNNENEIELTVAIYNNNIQKLKQIEIKNIHFEDDIYIRLACSIGNLEIIQRLVQEGANLHIFEEEPLRNAIENKKIDVINYLLYQKADIHVNNELPLMIAIEVGDLKVIDFLIKNGANISLREKDILELCYEKRFLHVIQYLWNQEIQIKPEYEEDLLLKIVEHNAWEILQFYIQKDFDVKPYGLKLFQEACRYQVEEMIDFLLFNQCVEINDDLKFWCKNNMQEELFLQKIEILDHKKTFEKELMIHSHKNKKMKI